MFRNQFAVLSEIKAKKAKFAINSNVSGGKQRKPKSKKPAVEKSTEQPVSQNKDSNDATPASFFSVSPKEKVINSLSILKKEVLSKKLESPVEVAFIAAQAVPDVAADTVIPSFTKTVAETAAAIPVANVDAATVEASTPVVHEPPVEPSRRTMEDYERERQKHMVVLKKEARKYIHSIDNKVTLLAKDDQDLKVEIKKPVPVQHAAVAANGKNGNATKQPEPQQHHHKKEKHDAFSLSDFQATVPERPRGRGGFRGGHGRFAVVPKEAPLEVALADVGKFPELI